MSKNASSGLDANSVTSNSKRGEHIGITASLENVSDWNNIFHELNANDDTWGKWIFGPKNTFWPLITHSSEQPAVLKMRLRYKKASVM